jgi:hypothetical protein
MSEFAKASQLLTQPLAGESAKFVDPTFPRPAHNDQPQDFDIDEYPDAATKAQTSPYGDFWDVFWIGHCGTNFPPSPADNPKPKVKVPLGRAIMKDDPTVPEPQHINMQLGSDEIKEKYPAHTRAVSRSWITTCSLGYAVSQSGARRLLWDRAIKQLTGPFDLQLQKWCQDVDDRGRPACLSVQPQLFQHHRPRGSRAGESDISPHGNEFNEVAFSRHIRWSTRVNFEKLVKGETDYIDLFKDGDTSDDIGF